MRLYTTGRRDRTELLRELLREIRARLDLVELHVAEGVPRHGLSPRFELCHNVVDARTF